MRAVLIAAIAVGVVGCRARDRVERTEVTEMNPPPARGGGPAESVYWPAQARSALAAARCEACGGGDECLSKEQRRLAAWRVDACERIELDACLNHVRSASCGEIDWNVAPACAPSRVCVRATP